MENNFGGIVFDLFYWDHDGNYDNKNLKKGKIENSNARMIVVVIQIYTKVLNKSKKLISIANIYIYIYRY